MEAVNKIKIKYFNKDIDKVQVIDKGSWIDLRCAEETTLKAGEYKAIPLGVGMILPENYEAIVAPRSSTFKKYGIIVANSIGIIDNSYNGDEDQWHLVVYALRDTTIPFNDRICQFRILGEMGNVSIDEVDKLNEESRGGLGSTGTK